jgi:hypothetical protein
MFVAIGIRHGATVGPDLASNVGALGMYCVGYLHYHYFNIILMQGTVGNSPPSTF